MAMRGLRTLAVAFRTLPDDTKLSEESVENSLVLLGIVGIIDPPHEEVPEAIKMAQAAGIGIIMITGDNSDTAVSIAGSIGLGVDRAITSRELSQMDDNMLGAVLKENVLFARARPDAKLRIVKMLKSRDEGVSMI